MNESPPDLNRSGPPQVIKIIQSILISLLVALATATAGVLYLVKLICCR